MGRLLTIIFAGLTVLLIVAGTVHGKPRAQHQKQHHHDERHQDLHGDEVCPGAIHVGHPDQTGQRIA